MRLSRRSILCLIGGGAFAAGALPLSAAETTYDFYVDAELGSDSNDGRTPQRAKRSLAALTALPLGPGVSVGLARGRTWRETLSLTLSGRSDAPVRVGAYGSGERPRISASEQKVWSSESSPTPTPTPTEESSAPAAGIFASLFDDPDFRDWDGLTRHGARLESVAAPSISNARALVVIGDGRDNRGYLSKQLPPFVSGQAYVLQFSFYFNQTQYKSNTELRVFRLFDSTGGNRYFGSFNLDSAGRFAAFTFNGHAPGCGGVMLNHVPVRQALRANHWNTIELELKVDASAGGCRLTINGELIVERTNLTTAGAVGVNGVTFGSDAYAGGLRANQRVWFERFAVSQAGQAAPAPVVVSTESSAPGPWSAVQAEDPLFVSYRGRPGRRVASPSNLTSVGDWCWESATGRLSVFCDGDPTTLVEVPVRANAIYLKDCEYVELSDICWSGARDHGLFSLGRANGIALIRCLGELSFEEGVEFSSLGPVMDGCSVVDSEFRYNGSSGLLAAGWFRNWLISSSSFHHNCLVESSGRPAHIWQAGLKLWGANVYGGGTIVERCNIYENGSRSRHQDKGIGLWLDEVTGVTARGNVVSNNDSWGVYLEKTIDCEASYNISSGNARTALYCAGLGLKASSGADSRGNRVYHNTVYNSGYWGLYLGTLQSLGYTRFDNNHVRNNIVSEAAHQVLYVEPGGDNNGAHGSNNIYRRNCYGVQRSYMAVWNGVRVDSYAELDQLYGGGMSNVSGDPRFSNPAGGDLSLALGSPCIDAGEQISGFTQTSSGAGPDLGAIER